MKRLENSQAQGYSVKPEPPLGDLLLNGGEYATWATLPPWSDWGGTQYGEEPNYSLVEFYVTPFDDLNWEGPELSRRSRLEPGQIVGLLVSVHDSDASGWGQGWYLIARPTFDVQGQPFFWAENSVDAELIPCYVGDCSLGRRTAVAVDSWGRIKAGFGAVSRSAESPGPRPTQP